MVQVIELKDNQDLLPDLKELLTAYGDYMYGELSLIAGKETFYNDLSDLPGEKYSRPYGTFLIALNNNIPVGCTGIKKYSDEDCEMKRMFIRPQFRGQGIGKLLCKEVIRIAKELSYKRILLDTNEEMNEAVALYIKLAFEFIPPYCINENDHPLYMQYLIKY